MKTSVFKLLPKQIEFLHTPNNADVDVSIYQGGYGSGKTFIGSFISVLLCLKYAGIHGIVGALDFSLLEKTTIDSIKKHLGIIGMREEVHYNFSKRGTRLSFINGSQIDFVHLKDFENFKSMECGFFEVEECSQVSWEVIKHTFGRLRQPKKPEWGDDFCYRWFAHTNVGGKRGWIHENFTVKPLKNSRLVKASTLQNTYLSPIYIEQMMAVMNQTEVEQYINGNDIEFDDKLMFPYFGDDNIREYTKLVDKYYLCCDFNVNPMTWYVGVNDGENFHVIHEYIGINVTTDEMVNLHFDDMINTYGKNIVVTGDATGRSRKTNGRTDYATIMDALSTRGVSGDLLLSRKNPEKAERLSKFNGIICNFEGVRRLIVDPSCKKFIWNMYNAERNAQTNTYKEPSDRMIQTNPDLAFIGHPIDAVSYWVYNKLTLEG